MTVKAPSHSKDPLYPWAHQRRFNAAPQYFRKQFGGRLQKVSIDAGFSCPNRDGSLGTGGCTFCNNQAFNPAYCDPGIPVRQQVEQGIRFHRERYHKPAQYLAYFQAFSNTHAPVGQLRALYEEALNVPEVAGLAIGTRPDCLDEAKLDLLAELAQRALVFLEIGIESCHDRSLRRVRRGHDYACAVRAIRAAAAQGLHVGSHVIFGLPGESRADWLAMAPALSTLPLKTLKCHQLQLLEGTALLSDYARRPEDFDFPELADYLDFLADFLELLRPDIVVERFFAEAPPQLNRSPLQWPFRNDQLLQKLEQHLEARNTWQGRKWRG